MELAKIPIYQTSRGLLYFAHVPRTAGTSIENRLKKEFGSPAFLDRAWKPDRSAWNRSSPQHVPWRDFLALFPLEFFCEIFSLVREPAQRLKSVYLFQKNIKGTVPSDQSFSKWLRAATEEGFANSRIFDNHTLPMNLIVPLDAKVFRLEDGLAEFDNYLLTNFGARNSGFERANSSGKNASDEVVVSRDDLELIEVVYAEDYERFGYDTVTSKRNKRHLYSSRQKVDQRGRDLSSWDFVVQAPTPRPMNQRLWGDTHFAWALVSAIERLGHKARMQTRKDWSKRESAREIDIVLRGDHPYHRRSENLTMYWLLYHSGDPGLVEELALADHVCFSGPKMMEDFSARLGPGVETSFLPQAFDAQASILPSEGDSRNGVVFAGLNRRGGRPIVRQAVQAGIDVRLCGRHWERDGLGVSVEAEFLPPRKLARFYRSAEIVLNDHRPEMRTGGSLSNRVFDALAAGAAVISDPVAWMPDEFRPFVEIVENPEEMRLAFERIRSESEEKRQARIELAREMRSTHSFDQRAKSIVDIALRLLESETSFGEPKWSN